MHCRARIEGLMAEDINMQEVLQNRDKRLGRDTVHETVAESKPEDPVVLGPGDDEHVEQESEVNQRVRASTDATITMNFKTYPNDTSSTTVTVEVQFEALPD